MMENRKIVEIIKGPNKGKQYTVSEKTAELMVKNGDANTVEKEKKEQVGRKVEKTESFTKENKTVKIRK